MGPAWDSHAFVRVGPQVGGTCIWDHLESLSWGTDRNINEILSITEISNLDFLSSGNSWITTKEFVEYVLCLSFVHVDCHLSLVEWDSGWLNKVQKECNS